MGKFYNYIEKELKENVEQATLENFNEFMNIAELDGFKLLGSGSVIANETCQRLYDLKLKDRLNDNLETLINKVSYQNDLITQLIQRLN